jgi:hypothetical protein
LTPLKREITEKKEKSLSFEGLDKLFVAVVDADFHRHLSDGEVSGASEAWVIGAERHLDLVENCVIDFAFVYQAFCRVADRHADGGVVVSGGDYHVYVFDERIFVEGVVMDEGAACGFDDSDAVSGFAWLVAYVGAGDFGVFNELQSTFCSVEQFNETCRAPCT